MGERKDSDANNLDAKIEGKGPDIQAKKMRPPERQNLLKASERYRVQHYYCRAEPEF
jgi:hypothetical protein